MGGGVHLPGGLVSHPEALVVVGPVGEEGDLDLVRVEAHVLRHILPAEVPALPRPRVGDPEIVIAVGEPSLQPERVREGQTDRLAASVSDHPAAGQVRGQT